VYLSVFELFLKNQTYNQSDNTRRERQNRKEKSGFFAKENRAIKGEKIHESSAEKLMRND
jgi:hypothetical protein